MSPPAPLDRRLLTAIAAGAGLLVVLAAVFYLSAHRAPTARGEVPEPHGALQVRMGATGGAAKVDARAPLRCFVGGRFVGEIPLGDCAARNGVESGKLGVGVDSTGQVAASAGGGAELAPLPEAPSDTAAAAEAPRPPSAPAAECLRYGANGWRPAGVGLTLRACARVLFENRCVRPGDAVYGRYGQRTLRLVPGRVEVSPNDRDFSQLMDQDADSCTLDG